MTTQIDPFVDELTGLGRPDLGDAIDDQISEADLVAPEIIPSSRGWRRWLYAASFRLINLGESPDELAVRALRDTVRTKMSDTYKVAVLGARGGVGKTTVAATVGDMFAVERSDKVVAIDLDAAGGNLASRVDPTTKWDGRHIATNDEIQRYSNLAKMTGENPRGLEVSAAPHHTTRSARSLSAAEFIAEHDQFAKYYGLILVDCGTDLEHATIAAVLDHVNAVLMVTRVTPAGYDSAKMKLQWLLDNGFREMVGRTVLVINHDRPPYGRKDRKASAALADSMTEFFGKKLSPERVVVWPFDPRLSASAVPGTIIVDSTKLRKATRRRVLLTAAALGSRFAAT